MSRPETPSQRAKNRPTTGPVALLWTLFRELTSLAFRSPAERAQALLNLQLRLAEHMLERMLSIPEGAGLRRDEIRIIVQGGHVCFALYNPPSTPSLRESLRRALGRLRQRLERSARARPVARVCRAHEPRLRLKGAARRSPALPKPRVPAAARAPP